MMTRANLSFLIHAPQKFLVKVVAKHQNTKNIFKYRFFFNVLREEEDPYPTDGEEFGASNQRASS